MRDAITPVVEVACKAAHAIPRLLAEEAVAVVLDLSSQPSPAGGQATDVTSAGSIVVDTVAI
jgi:hypothetical protein